MVDLDNKRIKNIQNNIRKSQINFTMSGSKKNYKVVLKDITLDAQCSCGKWEVKVNGKQLNSLVLERKIGKIINDVYLENQKEEKYYGDRELVEIISEEDKEEDKEEGE